MEETASTKHWLRAILVAIAAWAAAQPGSFGQLGHTLLFFLSEMTASGPHPPLSSALLHALESYRARLAARFGGRLVRVALFGSRARGEAREDSDVDVLVLIEGADFWEQREAAQIAGDVAVEDGVWLSPRVYDAARYRYLLDIESPFARSVEREHIVI
jgi:predicted nucleotidyltransferase